MIQRPPMFSASESVGMTSASFRARMLFALRGANIVAPPSRTCTIDLSCDELLRLKVIIRSWHVEAKQFPVRSGAHPGACRGWFASWLPPGAEDDGVYLSAVKADLNPALFSHDADFFRLQLQAQL